MAKGDQEKAMADVAATKKEQSGNYYDYLNNVKDQGKGLNDQARNERSQIWQTGTDYAATGGITPEMAARLRATGNSGGGGGGGGGSIGAPGNYGNGPGSAFNYVGPSAFNNVNWNFDDARNIYRDLGNSQGGLTGEQLGNINRDTLKEFEKTGGYNDTQLADIRARSNSTVPAFFNSLQDSRMRDRIVSGQYGGGAFDASSAKIARQAAQQGAEQTRNTEIGLGDTIRQGRFQASSKLADLGLSTAQLISQNRMGAAGGLHNIELSDAQLQLAKAHGIDDYTINVATGKDRYATAEDQIAAQERIAMAGIGASSAASNAALNAANERYLIGAQQQGQQFGMGQLADIYRSASGPISQNNRDWLSGLQGYAGNQDNLLGLQGNLASQPGKWGTAFNNVMRGVGTGAGLLSGFSDWLPKGGGINGGSGPAWPDYMYSPT